MLLPATRYPILMYHPVTPPPPPDRLRSLSVAPDAFRRQMTLFRRLGYRGLSVRELQPYLRGERSGKVFGITFDDGFLNVLTHAMPVLDALGFTATCYFVAGRFGGENDWDAAADTARSPLMTHADMPLGAITAMKSARIRSTTSLSHVPAHVSEVQIVESKQRLEALSGQTVESFCYPYGDLDPRVRDQVRRGLPQRDDDPARLRRYARRSVPVAADHGRGRRRCDAAGSCAKARVQRCR